MLVLFYFPNFLFVSVINKNIWKGTVIVSFFLLLSRILGIFRESLLANYLGVGGEKTGYDLAFLLPDILNHIISTGYLSILFIPIFNHISKEKGSKGSYLFFSHLFNNLVLLLIVLISIFWVFSPVFLRWSLGDSLTEETFNLVVGYTRILLPAQIFFLCGALFTSVQHQAMRFVFPALLGVTYNLGIIIGGLSTGNALGFVWGGFIGAFLGGVVFQLYPVFFQLKVKYSLRLSFTNPFFIRYIFLSLPLVIGLSPLFSVEFIYRSYGSWFGEEAVAALSYAYRLMVSFISVTAFAVGVASYPYLSKLVEDKKWEKLNSHLYGMLTAIFVFLIPVLLVVLLGGRYIVALLLERGSFTAQNTDFVYSLFAYFIWSCFGISGYTLLVRYFYAMQKVWRVSIVTTTFTLLSIPIYLLLFNAWGVATIPIISSMSVSLLFLILLIMWKKMVPHFKLWRFLKLLVMLLVCFAFVFWLLKTLLAYWQLDRISLLLEFSVICLASLLCWRALVYFFLKKKLWLGDNPNQRS